MPFSVKATKDGETRKFTFGNTFPTWEALYTNIYKWFPGYHDVYLARFIFSASDTRDKTLIGNEAHSAAEYMEIVRPFWSISYPNGVLRFEVHDETPHKRPVNDFLASINAARSALPPFRPIVDPVPPPAPMDLDLSFFPPASIASTSTVPVADTSRVHSVPESCCSVSESKREMKELVQNFLRDFNKTVASTFGDDVVMDTSTPRQTPASEPQSAALPITTPPAVTEDLPRPHVDPESVHEGIWCDFCGKNVKGLRFKCETCPDFDLCTDCVDRDGITLHQGLRDIRRGLHHFKTILPPNHIASPPPAEPPLIIHRGVICDVCNEEIIGVRNKCLDCPDFDLCDSCHPLSTHPDHEFIPIREPGRVIVHTVRDPAPFLSDSNPAPATPVQAPAPPAPAPAPPTPVPVTHNATCDLCDSRIVGQRYKCVGGCPDFDTCSSCFRIVPDQHPGHMFVKISQQSDVIPASPARKQRHNATCDSCHKVIHGVRYKCMHPACPDYDLCAVCEGLPIPVHPPKHPLLKVKDVDTLIPLVWRHGEQPTRSAPDPVSTPAAAPPAPPTPPRAPVAPILPPIANTPPRAFRHASLPPAPVAPAPVAPTPVAPAPAAAPNVPNTRTAYDIYSPFGRPAAVPVPIPTFANLRPVTNPFAHEDDDKVQEKDAVSSPFHSNSELTVDTLSASGVEEPDRVVAFPNVPTEEPFGTSSSIIAPVPIPAAVAPAQDMTERTTSTPVHGALASARRGFGLFSPPFERSVLEPSLTAIFVSDNNIPDGHNFPPGAEFNKSWTMTNNSDSLDWPETTQLEFVAGHRMAAFEGAPTTYKVGKVEFGRSVDVWALDMKAPDEPGRYIGYWRLSDGNGVFFGHKIWCDIIVPEPDKADTSLASSQVIMPGSAPEASRTSAVSAQQLSAPASPSLTVPSTIADADEVDTIDTGSIDDTDSDDYQMWEETRRATVTRNDDGGFELVYDSSSGEEA